MATTESTIANYFRETLDVVVKPVVWQPGRRLPMFLRDGYAFYETELLGNPCLLMADKEPRRSAASIRKQMEQVRAKWDGDIIYVCETTTSDQRRRLIEQKISFVVPGNQMYLPLLGIDLREHFRRVREEVTIFSPATQATIILLLTESQPRAWDALALADRLGYAKMTASRALNELKSQDIGLVRIEGRTRVMEGNGPRRELWERTLPLLESPVKHRQHVRCAKSKTKKFGVQAGLTALAARTMLGAPQMPTLAVASPQWTELKKRPDVALSTETDLDAQELEVWTYDPKLFAIEGVCDPFSLYLSLKEDQDERVQIALEEMMEAIRW